MVNGWDEPIRSVTKLLWLPVRLTGKAQTAWKRLAPEAKQDFQAAKDALQKRFEPESKRQLYVVEFQTRKRRPVSQGTRSPTNFRSGGPTSLGNSVPLGPKFLGNWVLREYCTSRDLGPGGGGGGGGGGDRVP